MSDNGNNNGGPGEGGEDDDNVLEFPGAIGTLTSITPAEYIKNLAGIVAAHEEQGGKVKALVTIMMSSRGLTFHASTGSVERCVAMLSAGHDYSRSFFMGIQTAYTMAWDEREELRKEKSRDGKAPPPAPKLADVIQLFEKSQEADIDDPAIDNGELTNGDEIRSYDLDDDPPESA